MATALVITSSKMATGSLIGYLKDARDVSADCAQFLRDVYYLGSDLRTLQDLISQAKSGDAWFTAVLKLDVERGPFEALKTSMEKLITRLEERGRGKARL
jgi:hypothetical protein